MLSSGPGGFSKTPFTKGLLLLISINTVVSTLTHTKQALHLLFPKLGIQVWRWASSQLFFSTASQFLFGTTLLYHFRLLERLWGSTKYASLFFLSSLIGVSAQALTLFATGSDWYGPGPFSFLFTLLILYHTQVPVLYRFKILGIDSNDHLFLYFVALQVKFLI